MLMKTNKKHIIIPALMMAVGVGLVGSISGTVAWYQYSTRVQVSYIGASAKCTENIQMSLDGSTWKSEFATADIIAGAAEKKNGTKFQPVTPGTKHDLAVSTEDSVPDNFKGHPIYQYFNYTDWQKAPDNSYLQFDLWFRVIDVDENATSENARNFLAKNLYFADFVLDFTPTKEGVTDTASFKNAVRIHFEDKTEGVSNPKNILLSNTAGETRLGGKLDLNGDNAFDKTQGYEWTTPAPEEAEYGDATIKQTTAAIADYTGIVANGDLTPATNALGKTVAGTGSAVKHLHYTVTIWLEGWHGTTSTPATSAAASMWDVAKYIGSFNLGMRFGITNYGGE